MGRIAPGFDLGLLAFLGLLLLFDVAMAAATGSWIVAFSGGVTAYAVASRRRSLETMIAAAVLCSLGVSVISTSYDLYPSTAEVVGMLVLTTTAMRRMPRLLVFVYVPATGIALMATGVRHDSGRVGVVLVFALFFAIAVATGGYLRWLDQLRTQAATEARLDERLDLARELHDLVAHYVTGIVVQAQAAQVVAERNPGAARDALVRIEQAGTDALVAMRRLVGSLRSGESTDRGAADLPPAGSAGLEDLVRQHNELGLPVVFEVEGPPEEELPPSVAASLHRIALESLTNVRRHAVDVTRVDLIFTTEDGWIGIKVQDDGKGPKVARRAGYGLVGMSERAAALGGTLSAGPNDEADGWTVEARFPIERRDMRTERE